MFRAVVWGLTHNLRRATLIAAAIGRGIAFLLILAGVGQLFAGNISNGLWIAFIGWFLENAAVGEVRQQVVSSLLAGHRVSEAMSRSCTTTVADATLQQVIDQHILGRGHRCLVIMRDEEVARCTKLERCPGKSGQLSPPLRP